MLSHDICAACLTAGVAIGELVLVLALALCAAAARRPAKVRGEWE